MRTLGGDSGGEGSPKGCRLGAKMALATFAETKVARGHRGRSAPRVFIRPSPETTQRNLLTDHVHALGRHEAELGGVNFGVFLGRQQRHARRLAEAVHHFENT